FFFFQAEDGIRDDLVTGVQTCALPISVAVVQNLARYLNDVKGADLWAYAADVDATTMWDVDLSGGLALVFGAEGKGVRPLVRRACDDAVSIPLAGRVESLNVSVAAGVLLYEAKRQRGGSVRVQAPPLAM